MLIGPFLDRYVAHEWVFRYDWSTAALVCLAVSCSLAVGVNLSQFACLGRFSAVSYQVPAPTETCSDNWVCPVYTACKYDMSILPVSCAKLKIVIPRHIPPLSCSDSEE